MKENKKIPPATVKRLPLYLQCLDQLNNDDTGISEDPEIRFQVAKKIVERASDFGIQPNDIIVDPLVMPIGAMPTAGQQVFELVKKLK